MRAQQVRPVIGFLGTVAQPVWTKPVAAFEQQLRERGWVEGRTITIIYRWAEGRSERFTEIAAEFVSRKVDVYRHRGKRGFCRKTGDIDNSDRLCLGR
jgi:putative ABC transport system substrate-binding protein